MNRLPALSAALVVLALLAGCPPAKDTCYAPSIECGGRCLDASSDPANCGACGHACTGTTSCCGGSCVDVHGADPANCGACGRACPVHGVCTDGTCACTDPSYLDSTCPGLCTNLQTGVDGSCGQCGWSCLGAGVAAAEAPCVAGLCVCAGTPTATDCGNGGTGQCVNTLTDPRNCGGCGAGNAASVCKPRARCTSGSCRCSDPAFPDDCTGSCVDLRADPANCGACGHVCPASAPSCQAGLCCAAGRVNCAGACVDAQTSAANCGACGHACDAGQACVAGSCSCSGATPLTCGTSCCGGTACCGTACQTAHTNGLGGTFHDCSPAYGASNRWTGAAAAAAADSWASGTTYDGQCDGSCLARQTASSCAVWCYGTSYYAGKVTSGATLSCTGVCNNFYGGTALSTWQ